MSKLYSLPDRCNECAKSLGTPIHKRCRVCNDLQLEETIFCDLLRSVQQDHNIFQCHAFQPKLSLVDGPKDQPVVHKENPLKLQALLVKKMTSEKIKYQKALALQKLARNPDEIIVEIKYHLAWNIKHRKPLFTDSNRYFDTIYNIFQGTPISLIQYSSLMWLAPDHIHVYVESDGESSPESVIQELKTMSNEAIWNKFPDLESEPQLDHCLWDEGYFATTIG